jgi:anti-anti-sigma regulatory factor
MWKMTKVVDRDWVTLRMSGHLEAAHLVEIQNALAEEGMDENVVLDLSEVTVIAQEAVGFLVHFEVNRIDLRKCPAYIRQWIAQERRAMKRREQSESIG